MIGILFDLDGTLLDTLQDLCDATNYALVFHGFPQRSLSQVRRFVGNGMGKLITQACPEGTPPETAAAVLDTFLDYYAEHNRDNTRPYPGILALLTALRKEYPIAIVSNKMDAAVKALCADYFPGINALGETADCPRKPAPDMLYKGMTAIGADRCIYVGDSEVDVLTAANAGVPCVSVLWGFRDQAEIAAAGGTLFCSTPEELCHILPELAGK